MLKIADFFNVDIFLLYEFAAMQIKAGVFPLFDHQSFQKDFRIHLEFKNMVYTHTKSRKEVYHTMNQRPYRMSFRERLFRFFSGRNGSDALGTAVLLVAFAINIGNIFLNSLILYLVSMLLLGYSFFRMFSRNVYKRQIENQRFCRLWKPFKNFFVLQKNKRRDRKTHVYKKCKHCKKVLRLPRVKGQHTVKCPCCQRRFSMKVR